MQGGWTPGYTFTAPSQGWVGGEILLVTVPAQAQHFRSNLLAHAMGGQASRPVAPSSLGGGGWGG